MKRVLMIALVGILLLSACDTRTGITVQGAWARPALQGGNGAVYFVIQNHSANGDELVGVASDVAAAVEMHESKMLDDVMQMKQVISIPVKGKESIEFAPGGLHVMLIGLKQELKIGDQFQITLQFASHDDVTVSVSVNETGESDPMSDH